jgi:hypothetical protein
MSGPAHLPYLMASLVTLRKHWSGQVIVNAWPESYRFISDLDSELSVAVQQRSPEYRGKNDQFLDKMKVVMQCHPNDVVLYLDADTTIHGDLSPLFESAEKTGFCATQFCGWRSNEGIARGRVADLLKYPKIPKELVQEVIDHLWPSVNGGVWAAKPTSPVLPLWYEWTKVCIDRFIADECVLHVLMAKFWPDEMYVLQGGRWNCSPLEKFQPKGLCDEDVVIRHYHGDSNVRPDKSEKGFRLWWPIWEECLRKDVGGCRGWYQGVGNKWMDGLYREQPRLARVI